MLASISDSYITVTISFVSLNAYLYSFFVMLHKVTTKELLNYTMQKCGKKIFLQHSTFISRH